MHVVVVVQELFDLAQRVSSGAAIPVRSPMAAGPRTETARPWVGQVCTGCNPSTHLTKDGHERAQ